MKTIKKIIGICLLIISFLLSQHIFSNWDVFKAGLEGNCIESN